MPTVPPRPDRLLRALAACLLACLVAVGADRSPAFAEEEDPEYLVPAALGVRTDGRGNTWNLEPDGSLGRVSGTMINSGLTLEINDQAFDVLQPMMTRDGREFVLQGKPIDALPGLQLQRRVRLLDATGALRYAEVFYNGSTDPMVISVGLTTKFSGSFRSFLTDRGRTEPLALDDQESGLVVLPGAGDADRAVLFTLASRGNARKPSVTARNGYLLGFRYPLELAPGETKIVVHRVAQVVIPRSFTRTDLRELFRPHQLDPALGDLPEEAVSHVVNVTRAGAWTRPSLAAPNAGPILGIEPGEFDILVMGEETRLVGEAEGGSVSVASDFGVVEVPLSNVAAIRGRAEGDASAVHLRDGQIVRGRIEVPDFRFRPSGGGSVEVDAAGVDKLVFARDSGESEVDWGGRVLIETWNGERIVVEEESFPPVDFVSVWGPRTVAIGEIDWFGPGEDRSGSSRIEFTNGTRCHVMPAGGTISLSTDLFGEVVLSSRDLRSIHRPGLPEMDSRDDPLVLHPHITLSGDQRLVGDFVGSAFAVRSGDLRIETEWDQVRRLVLENGSASRTGDAFADHSVEIERWDGGVVSGVPVDPILGFRIGERIWRLPLGDVRTIENPSPELTEETRGEIEGRIARLASESWREREEASRELAAFGHLAGPLLRRELQRASEPEVRRRLERILAELQ